MAYLLSEANVDHLLEVLKNAHARAVSSPYWIAARTQPEVMEIIRCADAVESEVRRNREAAPNVDKSVADLKRTNAEQAHDRDTDLRHIAGGCALAILNLLVKMEDGTGPRPTGNMMSDVVYAHMKACNL